MLRLLVIVSVFMSVLCARIAIGGKGNNYYTKNQLQENNYANETYNVVTKDGYILEVVRIPQGKIPGPPEPRPVVFLMHGLLGASNSFTYAGPDHAIAYILADAGYDVWMGNARGNRLSRRHVSLDPDKDKSKFFDFTFEEIGLDDLPTMIDFVLTQTKQEKLHYIGHSQGGTVFLVFGSMKPEYHKKIASAHLLAGVGYQDHFPNSSLRTLASSTDLIYSLLRRSGNVELYPPEGEGMFGRSHSRFLDSITDIDGSSPLMAGAATKQIAHYGQNVRDKAFRRWSFGSIQNLSKYGSIVPPSYDLSQINIDVTFHYSLNDSLLSEEDTLAMAKAVPNAKVRKVPRDSFTHLDYITSEDAKEQVIDFIVDALKRS